MTCEPIITGNNDRRITLDSGYMVRRERTSHGSQYVYRQHRGATPAKLRDNMASHSEAADVTAEVYAAATRLSQSARAAQERHG